MTGEMGEVVKFRDRLVTIGTCERLYYTSYQKFKEELDACRLKWVDGNLAPHGYINPANGFIFRFPFPDEDSLRFGEIIEPFDRSLPITLSHGNDSDKKIEVEILGQQPIYRDSDGKLCLALVIHNPALWANLNIHEDYSVRKVIYGIVLNNIINEPDPQKSSYYRAAVARILKGYGLNVLNEYRRAVVDANRNRKQDLQQNPAKRFRKKY